VLHYAQEYFQNTGVRCRVEVPARLLDFPISTQERHNLFMVVKEALNNVLKHAEATEVRVSLAEAGGKVTIVVADNGRGFAAAAPAGSGNGLGNMKERMERIGGRLELQSQPGAGTKVILEANGG